MDKFSQGLLERIRVIEDAIRHAEAFDFDAAAEYYRKRRDEYINRYVDHVVGCENEYEGAQKRKGRKNELR